MRALARVLRNAWPDEHLLLRVSDEVGRRVPGAEGVIAYMRAADGGLGAVGHNFSAPYGSWEGVRGSERIPDFALYPLSHRDRWAHTPVLDRLLYVGRPDTLEEYRRSVLDPNGLWFQLRVTLYDRRRLLGYLGLFRPSDSKRFDGREAAMLELLVPDLRRLFHVAQLLHGTGLRSGGVFAVLDALGTPSFLVTRHGAVVHANPPARALYPEPPPWLREACKRPGRHRHLAGVHPVPVDGVPLTLVQTRDRLEAHPAIRSLPPSLARVGERMARGLSDKEIAAELDLPLATARTYAQRVLRRLGLNDRRQLMLG